MPDIIIENQIFEELYSAEQISARVRELATQVEQDCAGEVPVLLGVLKGASIFAADFARAITKIDVEFDFVRLTSYGDSETSSGKVTLALPPSVSCSGRTVIIVEDIIDTGRSMQFLIEQLKTAGAKKVVVCALLHKPEGAVVDVPIDYVGFVIPNRFVVGYGLDYKQFKRNLPAIFAKK